MRGEGTNVKYLFEMVISRSTVQQRPRRRLDDVRRPQILATTVELIREHGLWNVRLADVAAGAGISATSVVYYFGSKDQLFAQAIAAADDAFYDPLLTELTGLQTGTERIARLLQRSSTSDWPLWMDLWVYSRSHPETATAQRRFHERWRSTIADVVTHGCATGEWSVADPGAVALRLSALTDGLAVHMVLGDLEHTPDRYVAMSLVAASLELGCDLGELERAAACPAPRSSG
jgi:AcrR family transcriptional regulator